MNAETRAALEAALGARIERSHSVTGGDINQADKIQLSDGRSLFVKTNEQADPHMFPSEARGLKWLGEAAALRVPQTIAVSSGRAGEPAFLVLEYLPAGHPRAAFDEELGRGLALLHRSGA